MTVVKPVKVSWAFIRDGEIDSIKAKIVYEISVVKVENAYVSLDSVVRLHVSGLIGYVEMKEKGIKDVLDSNCLSLAY